MGTGEYRLIPEFAHLLDPKKGEEMLNRLDLD